ncbi:MAG: hypothetical protein HYS18_08920 [Burkholderiales bacterium]|nr:hypothetical protein [Burkholderiales bacterium]
MCKPGLHKNLFDANYLLLESVVLPEDVAPVEPDVPELLLASVEPLEGGALEELLDEGCCEPYEPLDEPMPELLELPELSPLEDELVDGETDPLAVPPAEPMPELEPDIVPELLGGVLLHAANKSAQAIGDNHFNIRPP